jgi:hypothetical protein
MTAKTMVAKMAIVVVKSLCKLKEGAAFNTDLHHLSRPGCTSSSCQTQIEQTLCGGGGSVDNGGVC